MILRSANETFIYIPLYFELFSNLRQDSLHDWRSINISAMTLPRYTAENCALMMTNWENANNEAKAGPWPTVSAPVIPLVKQTTPSASTVCQWKMLCGCCRVAQLALHQMLGAQLALHPTLGSTAGSAPKAGHTAGSAPNARCTTGSAPNAGWHSWLCTKQLVSVLTYSHFCSRFTLVFALSNGVWCET